MPSATTKSSKKSVSRKSPSTKKTAVKHSTTKKTTARKTPAKRAVKQTNPVTEMSQKARRISVNSESLDNNNQRALVILMRRPGEWIPRTQFNLPSTGSRIRDLRSEANLMIDCANAETLKKRSTHSQQTYYRLRPESVTQEKVEKVMGKRLS